jgi:hypothetical protein
LFARRCGRSNSAAPVLREHPFPAQVDVLIVGAGYTGLAAARETAAARAQHAGAGCGCRGLRLLQPQRRASGLQLQAIVQDLERAAWREAGLRDLPGGPRGGSVSAFVGGERPSWIAIGANAGASMGRTRSVILRPWHAKPSISLKGWSRGSRSCPARSSGGKSPAISIMAAAYIRMTLRSTRCGYRSHCCGGRKTAARPCGSTAR